MNKILDKTASLTKIYTLFLFLLLPVSASAQMQLSGTYNGFLGQTNILECENNDSLAANIELKLFSAVGSLETNLALLLPAKGAQHIILNDLADIEDRYGAWTIESSKQISCRTTVYKRTDDNSLVEFAYTLSPLTPMHGKRSGGFNSQNPSSFREAVPNWISLVNLEDRPFEASVFIYSNDGRQLAERKIFLESKLARVDVSGGHEFGESNGVYSIVPKDSSHSYSAWMMRYGVSGINQYSHVITLLPGENVCSPRILPLSTFGLEISTGWLELNNPLAQPLSLELNFFDAEGILENNLELTIPGLSSRHLNLVELIGANNRGTTQILCTKEESSSALEAVAMTYGVHSDYQLEWAYGSTGTKANLASPYQLPLNTFLGMDNNLRLHAADIDASIGLLVYDLLGTEKYRAEIRVPAFSASTTNLSSFLSPDSYGRAEIISDTPIHVDLRRELPQQADKNLPFIVPTESTAPSYPLQNPDLLYSGLLGFTPWPPGPEAADVDTAYNFIANNSNLIAHHLDNGVPWQEALDGTAFPQHLTNDWQFRISKTPTNTNIFLAITPLDILRENLALSWGESGGEPLSSFWNNKKLNDPDIKNAFTQYALRAIDFFKPNYLAIGIETNILLSKDSEKWKNYIELNQHVYTEVKQQYPFLNVFSTVQYEHLQGVAEGQNETLALQADAVEELLESSDILALSTYRFGLFHNHYAESYFDLALGFGKPVAIAEMGAMSISTTIFSLLLPASELDQDRYVSFILESAARHDFPFVVNWLAIDFDRLLPTLGDSAEISKAWVHTGLVNSQNQEKKALQTWRRHLLN